MPYSGLIFDMFLVYYQDFGGFMFVEGNDNQGTDEFPTLRT